MTRIERTRSTRLYFCYLNTAVAGPYLNRLMPNRLTKTDINFCLDTFLLTVFLILCWSTVVVRYVFPPATKSAGWTLWGMDYLVWTDIQFFVLCAMAAAVLLHVMLHWPWVCGVVSNRLRNRKPPAAPRKFYNSSRTLWGVGLLIVIFNILGLAIAAAALSIQGPAM